MLLTLYSSVLAAFPSAFAFFVTFTHSSAASREWITHQAW
jgi:hypothetical protein